MRMKAGRNELKALWNENVREGIRKQKGQRVVVVGRKRERGGERGRETERERERERGREREGEGGCWRVERTPITITVGEEAHYYSCLHLKFYEM